MTDPVCGMEVTRETAAGEHDGRTYYFCSTSCLERFKADPQSFLTRDASDRGM
jgi:Cu+-exporting ATPase